MLELILSAGLLIVAPASFHPALADYVFAKAAERPVRLVALEDVLASAPGIDDPERLKRFLYKAHRTEQVGFVLLIGDADVLPVRYMTLDRLHAPAFDYAFYPSDLYYADVAKPDGSFEDWNGSREGFHAGYFGEVHGEKHKQGPINFDRIDYVPELAVGRWPCSTAAEVRSVARKTLRHLAAVRRARSDAASSRSAESGSRGRSGSERLPTTPSVPSVPSTSNATASISRETALLIAVDGWIDNTPAMDVVAASLAPRFAAERLYWSGVHRQVGAPAPDEAQVLRAIARSPALVLHSGHGNDDVWEKALSVGSLPKLGNDSRPAVMMSAGCSTARFATLPPYEAYVDVDGIEHAGTNHGEVFTAPPPPPRPYQRGRFNPTGLGECLVRGAEGGAVAYIGCNTGSQPCALTLQAAFAEAAGRAFSDGDGSPQTVGSAWRRALAEYVRRERLRELAPTADWYPASIFFQGMKFMLFGDPTAPL